MLSENEVEAIVARFMLARNWRRQRNHVGVFRTEGGGSIRVGEPGEPDWSYKRSVSRGLIQICHIEAKAEGVMLKLPPRLPKYSIKQIHDRNQLARIATLNYLGEPAAWINGIEMLTEWYGREFPNDD